MIALLVGTRPEIIKMAPVLRELQRKKLPFLFVHSNQHYSEEMDARILRDLSLPEPDIHLHVGSGSQATQTGRVMSEVEKVCIEKNITFLLVHGDTNTTLGGALAAKKLQIPVGHIEAGLRSFDWRMPEEINRTIVDRICDIHFCPTQKAKDNLLSEGMNEKSIVVTGNTVVDALNQHRTLAQAPDFFKAAHMASKSYILLTLHRAENIDSKPVFLSMLTLIRHAAKQLKTQVIWPMHPHAKQKITEFSLTLPESVVVCSPVGYLEMLYLQENAALVLTDSGGVQEESYILHTPVMTLRDSTERPETLSANFIIHADTNKFDAAWHAFNTHAVTWNDDFGTGDASAIIVQTLLERKIV